MFALLHIRDAWYGRGHWLIIIAGTVGIEISPLRGNVYIIEEA